MMLSGMDKRPNGCARSFLDLLARYIAARSASDRSHV